MKVEWRHTFFKLVGYFKAQEDSNPSDAPVCISPNRESGVNGTTPMLFGDRLKKAYGENR